MDVSLTFFIFHFFTRPEDFKLSKPKDLWNEIIQFHEKKIVLIISFHTFFGPCKPCYDVLKCAKNFLWLLVLYSEHFHRFFRIPWMPLKGTVMKSGLRSIQPSLLTIPPDRTICLLGPKVWAFSLLEYSFLWHWWLISLPHQFRTS